MTGVTKQFPGSLALNRVEIEVAPGEIHALLGENGAGKSTLLKILSGAQSPDSGSIQFAGSSVSFAVPHDAHKLGIVTIYQEFTLAPNMTIAENVFLGREPGRKPFVSRRKMAAQTSAITKQLGLDVKSTSIVRDLAIAEQQLVEIVFCDCNRREQCHRLSWLCATPQEGNQSIKCACCLPAWHLFNG